MINFIIKKTCIKKHNFEVKASAKLFLVYIEFFIEAIPYFSFACFNLNI